MSVAKPISVSESELRDWGAKIQNGSLPMLVRAQAMWSLRYAKEPLATEILAKYVDEVVPPAAGSNALLQHEAAYCLGQRGDPAALDALERTIRNENHEAIVRHEAGEALAALAKNPAVDRARVKLILADFLDSPIIAVSHSLSLFLTFWSILNAHPKMIGTLF